MNLEEIKADCVRVGKEKGFNNDQIWLERCMFKELGELIQAVEDRKAKGIKITDEEIGMEFADLLVFGTQYMAKEAPTANLDDCISKKIYEVQTKKKKTYEKGEFKKK